MRGYVEPFFETLPDVVDEEIVISGVPIDLAGDAIFTARVSDVIVPEAPSVGIDARDGGMLMTGDFAQAADAEAPAGVEILLTMRAELPINVYAEVMTNIGIGDLELVYDEMITPHAEWIVSLSLDNFAFSADTDISKLSGEPLQVTIIDLQLDTDGFEISPFDTVYIDLGEISLPIIGSVSLPTMSLDDLVAPLNDLFGESFLSPIGNSLLEVSTAYLAPLLKDEVAPLMGALMQAFETDTVLDAPRLKPLGPEEEAVVADPEVMVEAARTGDMAVVRKQLKAGVAVDAKVTVAVDFVEGTTALIQAAQGNQTKMSKFLVTRGADTNAKGKGGRTAMMWAAMNGNTELVGYLHENGAEVNAQNYAGQTALMFAAMYGKTATAKFLIEELKADKTLKDKGGNTAADIAMATNHPITFAAIDPAAAAKKGEEFEKAMEEAEVVDVISTRFQMAKSEKAKEEASKDEDGYPTYESCDPFVTAGNVKKELEGGEKWNEETEQFEKTPNGVIVFNPNTDNSLLMRGDPEAANAIWLLNWRKALVRAKKTGGRMIQIIVQGGLPKCRRRRRVGSRRSVASIGCTVGR